MKQVFQSNSRPDSGPAQPSLFYRLPRPPTKQSPLPQLLHRPLGAAGRHSLASNERNPYTLVAGDLAARPPGQAARRLNIRCVPESY